ncbi:preprotein translocase subunit SecG [Candidatus Marinamargulisbacteria bacterium SCGC AG-343-D04]|nr:preprotein translocase subunit SecG [Candidatus Marinamargulisbacteria bacterium SCGC AG-343-D04]
MIKNILLSIEFISAVLLIIAVLLHSAKGEGLGGIGGQARIFNSQKGLESGLDKITYALAFIFLLTAGIFGVFF